MPSPFNQLRQAVLDKLLTETTNIAEAHFEEKSSFASSPAAVVGVSSNEALYNSQKTDRVTIVFQIRIYIPLKDEEHTLETETRMGEAFWATLLLFNKRDALGAHADFVEPLPSIWGFEERGNGVYRFSEINLRCVKYLNQST
jgi:hypothetical protein